jgi:outer membrane lipoprotein-sorting protein
MKRIKLFLLLLFGFCFQLNAQDKANDLLNEVSSQMSSYDTMTLDFVYSLDNTAENVHQETEGKAYLKGDKYQISFIGNIFIYDGSQSIVIIPEDEEINVSPGNMEEEGTITPSKLLTFYKEGYTYKWDISMQEAGKNIQFIRLVPIDSNSEVATMLLGIDTDNKEIYKMIETGKDGIVTTFTILNFNKNEDLSETLFSFDEAYYESLDYIINKY